MSTDRTLPPPADGAVRLADWGLILAQGPEAAAFLNGQLTQDMLHLGGERARLAGYCSPKGRLLASFVAWQWPWAPETVALACSADLLAPTLKRLSMFVLRAKCKLVDASAEWPIHGVAGASAEALLPPTAAAWACGRHGEAQWIRLPTVDGVARALWIGPQPPPLPPLQADAWRWLEVRSGVPRIVAATADRFVPQMLNLELLDGVNFKKGCYPGQEVVARSQYRGTIKRRMYLMDSGSPLAPAVEVFHSEDPEQPAGMVVLCAPSPEQGVHSALVELKMAALQSGTLHAGSAEGPALRVGALPYVLEPLTD